MKLGDVAEAWLAATRSLQPAILDADGRSPCRAPIQPDQVERDRRGDAGSLGGSSITYGDEPFGSVGLVYVYSNVLRAISPPL